MAANGFERLFEIQQNQYTAGSPVILQAGVLLKNTQNGRLVIQMKFRSVSDKQIAAVVVALRLMDVTGKELAAKEHQYLDLKVTEGQTFGDRVPVLLSQNETRSYTAVAEKVVFADGSTWNKQPDARQLPLPEPQALPFDHDLKQQYRLRTMENEQLNFLPAVHGGLWQCGCGVWNRAGKEHCHACHASLDMQQRMADETVLRQQLDAFLQQEAEKKHAAELKKEKEEKEKQEQEKQRALEQEKRKAKGKKTVAIVAGAAVILAALIAVFTLVILPAGHERSGDEAFEAQNYALALEEYTAAGDRAYAKMKAAAEAYGDQLMQRFEYLQAADAYGRILVYTDGQEAKLKEARALATAQQTKQLYTTDDEGTPLPQGLYRYAGKENYSGMSLVDNGLIRIGENGWVLSVSNDTVVYCEEVNLILRYDDGLDWLYLINPENGEYTYVREVERVISVSEEGILYEDAKGLCGFSDLQGNVLVAPQYSKVLSFSNGFAAVQKDGVWGYINEKGEEVVPLQYVNAESFVNGYAKVYLNARKEKEGDYYVSRSAGWGLIDTEGNVVVQIGFDALEVTESELDMGVVKVKKDEQWALYSLEKGRVCSAYYDKIGAFSEGLAYGWTLMDGEDYYPCTRAEYIDKNGQVQLNLRTLADIGIGARDDCGEFIDGYAVVSFWGHVNLQKSTFISYYTSSGIYHAVIDREGNLIIGTTKDNISRRDNGDIYISEKGTYEIKDGVVRKKAETQTGNLAATGSAFMRQWAYVYPYSDEGIARVALNKGTFGGGAAPYGYVSKDEKLLAEPIYQEAYDFQYGYAAVKLDDKWGFLNTEMAYAIEPQYALTSRILDENGTALAKDTARGLYKLIDMEGNILLRGMELVDTLNYLDGHGMVQTTHGDTLRLYTTLGQRIF